MIVPSMTSKELYTEIFKDFEIVRRKAMYLTVGLRREAVKSKTKYVQRIYDYRSKQHNNWIIIVDYFVCDPRYTLVVYYVDDYGLNGIRVDSDDKTLTHFYPHFLERYNERFLNLENLSKLDLLKRFIPKNSMEATHCDYDSDDDQYQIFVRFKEGVGLGYKEVFSEGKEMLHYKTFISNEMIIEFQLGDFKSLGELYDKHWNELPKIIRKCA